MTARLYGAVAASLAALALSFGACAAPAASGAGPRAAFAAPHPGAHPGIGGPFRHVRRWGSGGFSYWPGVDDSSYPPPSGEPVGALPPISNDVHYTYTYDVPWDWAHRLPPMVAPSEHQYVPGCRDEAVTVPGRDGAERIVNVTRCY